MGSSVRRIDVDRRVERRARIALRESRQRATARVPVRALRARAACPSRYANVVSSGAIMPARAPASMDMLQIGHALVHRERADGRAAVFEHMARAAGYAHLADDGEDQILRGDPGRQPALDVDREGLRFALQQALGGEHVADFGAADAEGEGAERSVGARVAVAAHDGHAGLGARRAPD